VRMDLGLGPEIGFSDDRRRLRLDLHVYYCRTYYKALVTFTQLCDGRRERRKRGRLRWIADWSKLGYRGRHPRGALGPAPSYSSRLQPGISVDSDLEPDSGSDRLSCGLTVQKPEFPRSSSPESLQDSGWDLQVRVQPLGKAYFF